MTDRLNDDPPYDAVAEPEGFAQVFLAANLSRIATDLEAGRVRFEVLDPELPGYESREALAAADRKEET